MPGSWPALARVVAWYLALWTLDAVVWTVQFGLQSSGGHVNWVDLSARSAVNVYTNALVAAPLAYLAWRLPFYALPPYRSVPLYLLTLATATVARFALFVPLYNHVFGTTWNLWMDVREQFFPEFSGMLGVVALIWALRYYRDAKEREVRAARLNGELSMARLQALQSQIHPHFLFNALNGVSALMHRDVGQAEEMLARLCDLLRLTLYQTDHRAIPLGEELDIVYRYVEVMKMRFPERVSVRIDVPAAVRDIPVPPLLLQPLVENALRHGIDEEGRGVDVCISAGCSGGALTIHVADNGRGLPPGAPAKIGIGLGNTERRLQTLYGDEAALAIRNAPFGGTVVELVIPDKMGA